MIGEKKTERAIDIDQVARFSIFYINYYFLIIYFVEKGNVLNYNYNA